MRNFLSIEQEKMRAEFVGRLALTQARFAGDFPNWKRPMPPKTVAGRHEMLQATCNVTPVAGFVRAVADNFARTSATRRTTVNPCFCRR